jgi:hypothetical protein
VKTYWSGIKPKSDVGESVGGTESAWAEGLKAVKMIISTGRK